MTAHRRPNRKNKKKKRREDRRSRVEAQRSVLMPVKAVGLGGQKQALMTVPVRVVDGIRVSGNPDGDAGIYSVSIWLRKPDVAWLREGDFRFGWAAGDSHLLLGAAGTTVDLDLTYGDGRQHAKLKFVSNGRGALAGVSVRIQAPDFTSAHYEVIRIVSPTLSLWSTILDVPLVIDRVETLEEKSKSSRLTFVNPFLEASLRDAPQVVNAPANLRVFASYYREAMASNSDPYQLLCLFKIVEGIRNLRIRRQRKPARKRREAAALIAEETIPGNDADFIPWLERIFPVRKSPWDQMAVESIFIAEARGRSIAELVQPGARKIPPGPLYALRNQIAHSIGPGPETPPLVADEALHVEQVLHWLPITKCIVRLMLANEFPGALGTPHSRADVQTRLIRVLAGRLASVSNAQHSKRSSGD